LDRRDARNLAPDVEMEELQAIEHVLFGEAIDELDDLSRRQAELGAVARRFLPAPHTLRRELRAHAQDGPDSEALARLEDEIELLDAFEHDDDGAIEALRDERRLDVGEILVAVEDDETGRVSHHRE